MGMDSRKLSARARQPGHDQSFRASEQSFVATLRGIFPGGSHRVVDHPRDLASMLGGRYGVIPEASLEYVPTGRRMYFEVKKQGPRGNAEERACKHHTVQFYKSLRDHTGLDYHAFATIMCDSLATDPRYTTKHPFFFEPDHYFNWVDYEIAPLAEYLRRISAKYLERAGVPPQAIPR